MRSGLQRHGHRFLARIGDLARCRAVAPEVKRGHWRRTGGAGMPEDSAPLSPPAAGSPLPAQNPLASSTSLERYLDHVRTSASWPCARWTWYAFELQRLLARAEQATPDRWRWSRYAPSTLRRWVAQLHAKAPAHTQPGANLVGLAGFYAWLGREELVDANPIQDLRHLPGAPLAQGAGCRRSPVAAGWLQKIASKPQLRGYPSKTPVEAAWLEQRGLAP